MLQNEPTADQATPPAGQPTPPGQARITPDELTHALAAIERRRAAEAQRLAGTIPIDDAVSGLHLDATPAEIWSEVQSQRAVSQRAVQTPAPPTVSAHPQPPQTRPAVRPRPWRGILGTVAAVWVLYTTGLIPHFVPNASPRPPALTAVASQIPDGTQFYCDDAGLVQLSEGKAPAQVHVDPTQPFRNSWTLVKMGGHIYLHAYIAHTASVQPLAGKPLVVVNDDNSGTLDGEPTSQATLRIDGIPLQTSGGNADYTEITLPDFHPDPLTTTSPWR